MKRYTKLIVLAMLVALMMPLMSSASNSSEGELAAESSKMQGEHESNNDGRYSDNDDDDGDSDDDDGEDNDDDDGQDNDDHDGQDDDDHDGQDNDDHDGQDNDDHDGQDNDDHDGQDNDDHDGYDDNDSDDARSNSGRESLTTIPSSCQTFSETGVSVCDDNDARFLSAFRQYGLQNIGYPISPRFQQDGFITQGFQKAILQWRADSNSVAFVNVFDELHNRGFDEQLLQAWQTPQQLPAGWDGNVPFAQVVQKRQGLLTRSALRDAYFGASSPMSFFGLPTSQVQDMGSHYAIRLQRAVLQEWKKDVPWARAGQVTIANGGDIAKQLGYLSVR